MKAKRISTGEIVEVSKLTFTNMKTHIICRRDIKNGGFIAESDLEFLSEESKEVTIEGWVARDKSGCLFLHYWEPHRTPGGDKWYSEFAQKCLPKDSFPEVTWESNPKRVNITITPIEE